MRDAGPRRIKVHAKIENEIIKAGNDAISIKYHWERQKTKAKNMGCAVASLCGTKNENKKKK